MKRATKLLIASFIVILFLIVSFLIFSGNSEDNIKRKDVNNVPAQDFNNTTSPDPVKSSTGDNNDTDQTSTGNGNNLQTSP